jgi:hypothetical protein
LYGWHVSVRGRLALYVLVAACLLPIASAEAIPMGAYGNTARFDRLTGQKTKSGSSSAAVTYAGGCASPPTRSSRHSSS